MAFSSWLPIPTNSPFSLANIPFGIIQRSASDPPHPAIAIGDHVLDLALFSAHGGFSAISLSPALDVSVFEKPTLNAFAALGQPTHRAVRHYLQDVFRKETPYGPILRDNPDLQRQALLPRGSVQNLRPMHVGTFTDFFAGIHHARNCGVIFRGAANALQPNYTHLPVGYHSRASSVVVSGTPVYRPRGQILSPSGEAPSTAASSTTTTTGPKAVPILAPCRRLDMELELGAFLCKGNRLGEPIPIDQADEYIFGYVLVNDWSARDIQAWEAVPLGPFNAKSFCTTISPWVVLPDALEPFRVRALESPDHPGQVLLPYLREKVERNVFDINLEVSLSTSTHETPIRITKTSSRNLLFSFPQMIAHHTVNGCPLETGDLLGSGTISETEPGTLGSFLEMTQGGKTAVAIPIEVEVAAVPVGSEGGKARKEVGRMFLEDGDTVTITGVCAGSPAVEGCLVGFGECSGTIYPPCAYDY
ncbi:hypothetical protein ASPCAL02417 [Aspergillus calidoustus]|uniref:Fumarylacetoacetase n=1 Tax=Aspergillus calidoustus TaxID=454130 RepID=A0A0U5GMN9_ASPCI|nr:hypothetical protein ASPCAL02417 [Aspergillus calidoustus]